MSLIDSLWIISIGALVGISCGLVGSFLVLRRMAMLGDAISHAVLPGIAIAFLITKSRGSFIMLAGATVLGLLTAFFVQVLQKNGRVRNDAAIGVTFTSLFAVGVFLISRYARDTDLDLDCVLYGDVTLAPLYVITVAGHEIGPQAFWQMAGITALCLIVIALFFKELKITAFDPEMATAVGINATLMHYLLMGLVSVTTVGAFEPVGAILVVAMLVVPASTAYLLTDDLRKMLWLSAGVGVLSSVLGYFGAVWMEASIAGMMTVVAGACFMLAFLFSPSHGLVTKLSARRKLSSNVAREDALQALWRSQEQTGLAIGPLDATGLAALTRTEIGAAQRILQTLRRAHLVQAQDGGYVLTAEGNREAQELVHRHRAYESFLASEGYAEDHLHDAADRAEHFISPEMLQEMDAAVGNPQVDPHGKPIPHSDN